MKFANPKRHKFVPSANDSNFCTHCGWPSADHSNRYNPPRHDPMKCNPVDDTFNPYPGKWYCHGFGLFVIQALSKRCPGWESGVIHKGGIHSGHWELAPGLDNKTAKQIQNIFDLYSTEYEFLQD